MRKFPSFSQWKQIFKVLQKKERTALLVFFAVAVASFGFLVSYIYIQATEVKPTFGGTYIEGVVGQPRFINPVYGETNDVDRSLIDLVFSGLMTYDNEGRLTEDLAQSYEVSGDGKTYDFTLRRNVFWHDGRPLTADDVVYTIRTLQSAEYKSPLRANWIDVDVEKLSENSVRFKLKTPYNAFLENCTVKIIPQHIWENITPENFSLSYYNLQPVGSGPFAFEHINQTASGFIKTIQLESNRRYYRKTSYLAGINFQFFETKEDLARSANAGRVQGFSLTSLDNAAKTIRPGWTTGEKFATYSFSMPRYVALFFNQKSTILADSNIRKGISYAVNKPELAQKLGEEMGTEVALVDSPILPDFFGYTLPSITYEFDMEAAKKLFDKAGYKDNGSGLREKATTKKPAFQFVSYLKVSSRGNEVTQLQACLAKLDDNFKTILQDATNGIYGTSTETAVTEFQKKYLPDLKPTGETGQSTRKKLNELCLPSAQNTQPLAFTITTADQPQLVAAANIIKQQLEAAGVQVNINPVSSKDLKAIIKARNYEALLYGEALGSEPDLYPFWHSSQKIDPGLNLSAYENKEVDKLLKEARETQDLAAKGQKLEKLQNLVLQDAPAIFLYNPNFMYWVWDSVQGVDTTKIIDPAKRFSNVTNWFVKTKRVWK